MYSKRKYNPFLEQQLEKIPQKNHILQQSYKFDNLCLNPNQTTRHGGKNSKSPKKTQKQLYWKLKNIIKKHKSSQMPLKKQQSHSMLMGRRQEETNKKVKRKTNYHSVQKQQRIFIVKSKEEQELMSYIKPKLPVILDKGKSKTKIKSSLQKHGSTNPEQIEPNLTKILSNKPDFMKTYFADLKFYKVNKPQPPIDYQFPPVKVGIWKVTGYIMNNHVILKGVTKNGKQKIKKYPYEKAYERIRKNYKYWVEDKYFFQT